VDFGDIFAVDLPAVGGHEQAGLRPAIIAQSGETPYDRLSTVLVVPFTSRLRAQVFPGTFVVRPDAENQLRSPSVALVSQLRVVDRRRIGRRIGVLAPEHALRLRTELRALMSLGS